MVFTAMLINTETVFMMTIVIGWNILNTMMIIMIMLMA